MLYKFCFFAVVATSLALKSPVLIWSPSRGLSDLPQSYTGQTINSDDFQQSYVKPLTKDSNLVVFLQDRLSLQDLNHHADVYNPYSDGGSFKNIKSFMEDQFSAQISSVMSPWSGLENIMKDFEGKVHKVMESADLHKLDLGGQANIIIVNLKPVQGSSNEGKVFSDNDEKMAEITKQLTKLGIKYTAVYTGKTATKTSNVQGSGVSRRLQAIDDVSNPNATFMNITCPGRSSPFFFYLRGLEIMAQSNESNYNNNNITLEDDGTTCDNDTAVLKLKAIGDDMKFNLEWSMLIDNISEYWTIKENMVFLEWTNGTKTVTANETLVIKPGDLMAPKHFSYHCSMHKITTLRVNATANITLMFDGLQFQPFMIMDNQFSDGWDCVVFFTPGIWMALISVSIMILIVLYGLGMIASLKTMDRYDDPKGKTITVNVNE
ncbi:V-type proton ATPase subunit S1-like [Mytilus edulis]|uniref:V-type proton ATPase subunit S1-like n=1 Tax=Mytilus edulis TaxID=6550 RepID=UPI0039EEC089